MLAEILSRWTSMKVVEGEDGALIEPTVCRGVLSGRTYPCGWASRSAVAIRRQPALFRPIDRFLGTFMREKAIGIVLSGTGSDGPLLE